MSLFDLTGKVAAITGSTKGIGLGIAREMAAAGAKVIVSSRHAELCDEVAGQLNAEFGKGEVIAKGLPCDLTSIESVERFAAEAPTLFGGLDILVSNAAVLSWAGDPAETPPEVFEQQLTSNIHHNFRLCMGLRGAIAARGGGSIVLIGSAAGANANPIILSYSVAKAGVSHLAWNLAELMAPERIRVNCVSPGLVRSWSSTKALGEAGLEAGGKMIPLGRPGEPEDIAGAVIFLSSRAGAYVTGETILVDGGRSKLTVGTDALTQSLPPGEH
jgi:NAD(P)-dependent dehydrogenase (short-subunit alcohol dehydrogenase family)